MLIASPTRGDGKTTVAANLSLALAQDGRNVIAVDCDLRRPQLAKRLGVAEQVNFGLDSVLIDRREADEALLEVEVEGGRLRVLPGGSPPNPSVLLGSDRMRSLLARLREDADMVIIDTPPLLAVSDAIPLQEQVSGTVLVARMDYTSRDGVRKAAALHLDRRWQRARLRRNRRSARRRRGVRLRLRLRLYRRERREPERQRAALPVRATPAQRLD